MKIVYCFIGPLPQYAIYTVHQTRLFFDGDIYFIVSDITSTLVDMLRTQYHVHIIDYDSVVSKEFNTVTTQHYYKFDIIPNLIGREKLFMYSFERFFVLYNLMVKERLDNILFCELDNLLYNDPRHWKDTFSKKQIAFMFDNIDRCSSGICYIQNTSILQRLVIYFSFYIQHSNKFMSEMMALYEFWEKNKESVQILPTIWPTPSIPMIAHDNYPAYHSIFDAAALGIYLGGMDPYHTNGIIQKGMRWHHSLIDYTIYQYEWKKDEHDRIIPYVWDSSTESWIRINNLHIHSKELRPCLSKPLL